MAIISVLSRLAKKGEVLTRTVQTGYDRETGEAIFETEDLNLETNALYRCDH